VIDLSKCMRCYGCIASCRVEHFLPLGITWPRLIAWEEIADEMTTFPVRCNHCQEAPCVKVCITGATQQREDGIVWVDQDKCVGCRYCIIACPYQNRTFLSRDKDTGYFPGYGLTDFEKAGKRLYPHTVGTTEKCNFCMERIDAGLAKGLKPGVDREATPACVNACPAKALTFGDLDAPDSNVRQLIRDYKGFQVHPEYDTDPSIYYIDKGRRGV
ncbi:MAG: 4Fe-4S dicluster domain-containing protein, partial [Desulfobacteraceae bacterium]|nr:4Fe-4S dicluster domain-containing protein [Desulfobacteraceae bacterium]